MSCPQPRHGRVTCVVPSRVVKDALGNPSTLCGSVVIELDVGGKEEVLHLGTGQVPEDSQVGDTGTYRWVKTGTAFYPVFVRDLPPSR